VGEIWEWSQTDWGPCKASSQNKGGGTESLVGAVWTLKSKIGCSLNGGEVTVGFPQGWGAVPRRVEDLIFRFQSCVR